MQIVSLHDCVTTQHVLMLLEKQVPVEMSLVMQKHWLQLLPIFNGVIFETVHSHSFTQYYPQIQCINISSVITTK